MSSFLGSVPSLQDMCFRVVVQYLNCLEDVGDLDERHLSRILRHCNEHQLRRVERGTKGRDLSAVVDPVWKSLFLMRFGRDAAQEKTAWMKRERLLFTWKQLYDATEGERKIRDEEAARKLTERLKQMEEEFPRMHVKVLPSKDAADLGKRKRWGSWGGGGRSSFMKRAKVQISNSLGARVSADIKPKRTVTPAAAQVVSRLPSRLTGHRLGGPETAQRSIQPSPSPRSAPSQRPAAGLVSAQRCPPAAPPLSSRGPPCTAFGSQPSMQTNHRRPALQQPGIASSAAPSSTLKRRLGNLPVPGCQPGVQGASPSWKEPGNDSALRSSFAEGNKSTPGRTVVVEDPLPNKQRLVKKLRKY